MVLDMNKNVSHDGEGGERELIGEFKMAIKINKKILRTITAGLSLILALTYFSTGLGLIGLAFLFLALIVYFDK